MDKIFNKEIMPLEYKVILTEHKGSKALAIVATSVIRCGKYDGSYQGVYLNNPTNMFIAAKSIEDASLMLNHCRVNGDLSYLSINP